MVFLNEVEEANTGKILVLIVHHFLTHHMATGCVSGYSEMVMVRARILVDYSCIVFPCNNEVCDDLQLAIAKTYLLAVCCVATWHSLGVSFLQYICHTLWNGGVSLTSVRK